jgi:hypothetical protein
MRYGVTMKFLSKFLVPVLVLVASVAMRLAAQPLVAEESPVVDHGPAYGAQLEGFGYPWPVVRYRFTSQGQNLEMAYMDVKPARANGRVAVLLHGKNFCAATWQATIVTLLDAGYRVIAPDQIGFCKSSKPAHYSSASSSSPATLMPYSNHSGYAAPR